MDLMDWKAAVGSFRRSLAENLWNMKSWVRWGQALLSSVTHCKFGTGVSEA
jgi:hypothetical protein